MNKNIFMSVVIKNGDNCSVLASVLGISRITLSRKINEKGTSFTQPEIKAIVNRYSLSPEETVSIFFN